MQIEVADSFTSKETKVKDYFALLKPRVMYLVVFTAICGMLMSPGKIHPLIGFVAILSIALASGSAGAINMWYESDIDSIMSRTKRRPIPSKAINRDDAFSFAVVLSFIAVVLMGLVVNIKSALMLIVSILFYVVIYTIWLKRRTSQNIVIGGAAGAFPPIIGWISVTNSFSIEPIIMFLIIFLWTPPHFWALALNKSEDYRKAGIPMLPIVKGDKNTKMQILIYTILLMVVSLLPYYIKMSGILYLIAALVLGAIFIIESLRLLFDSDNKRSMKLFSYSIFYLFLLFTFLTIDKFYGEVFYAN